MGSGYIKGRTLIKRYCSIGKNVKLNLDQHRIDNYSTHPLLSRNNIPNINKINKFVNYSDLMNTQRFNLVIEHDVWVGDDCLILQGVHIGQGAVIGANSVVTKDVPPYAIVVGSPARLIRYRFSEEIIEQLLTEVTHR